MLVGSSKSRGFYFDFQCQKAITSHTDFACRNEFTTVSNSSYPPFPKIARSLRSLARIYFEPSIAEAILQIHLSKSKQYVLKFLLEVSAILHSYKIILVSPVSALYNTLISNRISGLYDVNNRPLACGVGVPRVWCVHPHPKKKYKYLKGPLFSKERILVSNY